jgi:hypothetical protein
MCKMSRQAFVASNNNVEREREIASEMNLRVGF